MSRRLPVGPAGAVVAGASLLALLASVRCANVDRGLGDACIRNEDCLSGVCAGQQCVAAPMTFDAAPSPVSSDAGADAGGADAAVDAMTGADTGTPPVDAGQPGHPDAHDAGDARAHDSAPQSDAPAADSAAHDADDTKDGGSLDAHTAPG